jgi:hypothetical protein
MDLIRMCLFVGCLLINSCAGQSQVPVLVSDYTGATQNLIPQGWQVNASQSDGSYYWMVSRDTKAGSPAIMQIIMPDTDINLLDFMLAILSETVTAISIEKQIDGVANELHCLISGKINGLEAIMVAAIVRDPNRYLFFNLFAAIPQEFYVLGAESLLYQCIKSNNPFQNIEPNVHVNSQTNHSAFDINDPFYYGPDGKLNMQAPVLQDYILQSSAVFTEADLKGEWMQVMGGVTGNVYQDMSSGAVFSGGRGYAHLLKFDGRGNYTLSYMYQSTSSGGYNKVEMNENGRYTLIGNELVLKRVRYWGDYFVYGKKTKEDVKNPPERRFRIGMLKDKAHMVIHGPEFEYTVSSHWDDGNIKLGFSKQ